MRLLVIGLLGFALVIAAGAQTYGGYPPYPAYYTPYPSSNVTVVVPPAAPPQPIVVVRERRPVTYMIAFKDSRVGLADAYWVNGQTLYYVTPDHQQHTALLASVDRGLSARLNAEQNVSFYLPNLPPQPSKAEVRCLLEKQLGAILKTRDTSRGVVVEVSDVLFEFNRYALTPAAREKLAKVAAILKTYGCLRPRLFGYTDNIGGNAYNTQLSRKRADAVRDYLVSLGVPAAAVTSAGLGEDHPVASNATAAGRQQNRRVEMLIPGDAIGVGPVAMAAE